MDLKPALPPTLPIAEMICFSLYAATHAMQHAYKPMLEALGLTYPQYLVLVALCGARMARPWGSWGQPCSWRATR